MHHNASMNKFCRLATAALFVTVATFFNVANAQVPTAFVGSWKASWHAESKSYDAVMVVSENGGTWETYTRNQNNPCAGRKVPMKIESATATDVLFVLQFSEVIPGCRNAKVTLKAAPDGVITGLRSNYELKLEKQ